MRGPSISVSSTRNLSPSTPCSSGAGVSAAPSSASAEASPLSLFSLPSARTPFPDPLESDWGDAMEEYLRGQSPTTSHEVANEEEEVNRTRMKDIEVELDLRRQAAMAYRYARLVPEPALPDERLLEMPPTAKVLKRRASTSDTEEKVEKKRRVRQEEEGHEVRNL